MHMRILNIEDFFYPKAGYQINLLSKFLSKKGHDVTIVTSEIEKTPKEFRDFFNCDEIEKYDKCFTDETGVKIIRVPSLGVISGRAILRVNLVKTINSGNYDLVFLHGNDSMSAIRVLRRTKKIKPRIVTDSHMLEMASKNRFRNIFYWYYRKVITPKIVKHSIPVIRNQDSEFVRKKLGVPDELSPYILLVPIQKCFILVIQKEITIENNSDSPKEIL